MRNLKVSTPPLFAACAQAVRLGAPAMLWQRALRCSPAPSPAKDSGAGAHDGLVLALSTALADLLVQRGGDELSAAALRIFFDPQLAAWYGRRRRRRRGRRASWRPRSACCSLGWHARATASG